MGRITVKDLEAVCQRINRTVNGREMEPYEKDDDGKWQPVPNSYHLSGAYGGYSLHRMVDDGGSGVHDVFSMGHMPKRELYDLMHGFLRGVEAREEFESVPS